MTANVFVPTRTYSFSGVEQVELETIEGRMSLLEHHVDCAAALPVGLTRLRLEDDKEQFIGIAGGTCVKIGSQVMISTPQAVVGEELGQIHERFREQVLERREQQKEAQQALARLEVEMARSIFRGDSQL
jgi:F-type H+-transporting ATPase subunit epsilon